jgi:hypothetical protein
LIIIMLSPDFPGIKRSGPSPYPELDRVVQKEGTFGFSSGFFLTGRLPDQSEERSALP